MKLNPILPASGRHPSAPRFERPHITVTSPLAQDTLELFGQKSNLFSGKSRRSRRGNGPHDGLPDPKEIKDGIPDTDDINDGIPDTDDIHDGM